MRDAQSWLDLAHGILRLIVAVVTFVLALAWWAAAVAGSLYWAYDWALPRSRGAGDTDLAQLLGLGDSTTARIGLTTAIGVFFLITLPIVVRGCALLQASFAKALLTGVAEMRDRITVLEEQKRAAACRPRRPRCAGWNATSTTARSSAWSGWPWTSAGPGSSSPPTRRPPGRPSTRRVTQTRETLDELRALSRGIAPPILVDRGLPSALAALAGRGTVPVELQVDPQLGTPGGRLDPAVENTAYFVVAEALTNIAKHSRATECHGGRGPTRARSSQVRVGDDGQRRRAPGQGARPGRHGRPGPGGRRRAGRGQPGRRADRDPRRASAVSHRRPDRARPAGRTW